MLFDKIFHNHKKDRKKDNDYFIFHYVIKWLIIILIVSLIFMLINNLFYNTLENEINQDIYNNPTLPSDVITVKSVNDIINPPLNLTNNNIVESSLNNNIVKSSLNNNIVESPLNNNIVESSLNNNIVESPLKPINNLVNKSKALYYDSNNKKTMEGISEILKNISNIKENNQIDFNLNL